jgi:hypothetical protein
LFSTQSAPPVPQLPQGRGSLSGIVRDEKSHSPLGAAKITAENKDVTVLTVSSNEGIYRIADLPPGQYQLKVEKPPYFKTFAVEIVADQNRSLDLLVGGL